MAEKKITIKVDTGQSKKSIDQLSNSLDKATENAQELNAETNKKSGQGVSGLSGMLSGLFPKFSQAISAVKSFNSTLFLLVANPIGATIAAIVAGLTILYKAFASTKAGGEAIDRVFAGIGATIDVLRDRVLTFGNAIKNIFTGDFAKAIQGLRDSFSGIGQEIADEIDVAVEATKGLQEVVDTERNLSVSRARLNRDLAASREIISDQNATYAQKIKAIKEIRIAEEKQTKQELTNAKKKLNAIVALNAQSDTDRENLDKEADARKAVYELEQVSAQNRRAYNKLEKMALSQQNSLLAEQASIRKENQKIQEEAQKEALKILNDAYIVTLAERDKEIYQAGEKLNADILALNKAGIKDLTAVKEAYNINVAKIEKKYNDEAKKLADENAKLVSDNLQAALDAEFAAFDKQLKRKTDKNLEDANNEQLSFDARLQAINDRESQIKNIYFENEEARTAFEKQNADARKKIVEGERDAKIAAALAVADTLANVANLIGKETAAGKALAVASATISAISSAQKAYESTVGIPYVGPVLAPINAGLALAAGYKNVKDILAVQIPGASGGGGAGGGASSNAPAAPRFNVVGASPASANQIAGTIGKDLPPVKAYVVANDVTSAQSLNRNIVSSASLG